MPHLKALVSRFLLLAALSAVCPTAIPAPAVDQDLEKITLLLKWEHAFQFAGYYAAVEKGYYRDVGLDVKLEPIELPGIPTDKLLRGEVEYITTDAGLFLYRASGDPVVALAAIFQHSPYAFLVREDSGITTVDDFKGKRVMLGGGKEGAELQATLSRAGLQRDDYTFVPLDFDVEKLVNGQIDVLSAYTTDQGFRLAQRGFKPKYILPAFYGVDFYGDILATTEAEIQNHPERVEAMLGASIKGWQYALDNPDEIIELILEKYNEAGLTREHLKYEADASIELIQPLLVGIGYMNPARWDHIREVFEELELVLPEAEIEGFLYQRTTTGTSPVQWLRNNWLPLSAALVLLFVAVLIVFLFQTRRLVRIRTAQLSESEAHLRDLIDGVPACVAALDLQGRVLSMNSSGLSMLKIDRLDDVRGRPLREFVSSAYLNEFNQLILHAISGRSGSLAYWATDGEGRNLWLESHCAPFRDVHGVPAEILTVTQNLTSRKSEEERHFELQRVVNQKQKMEALGQLSSGIAHDFNNILSVIMGNTELILKLEQDNTSSLSQRLYTMLNAGRRAKELVSNLLAFSRVDSTEESAVDLNPLVRENVSMLKSVLPASIQLTVECDPELPMVLVDRVHIQQLLFNLAINARDTMKDAGVLTIRLRRVKDPAETCVLCHHPVPAGDWIELSMTDDGEGIPATELERIFEPFYTTKAVGKGTGLGLAVIHGIMNREGRHVVVETDVGKGSTFRLLFQATESISETARLGPGRRLASYGKGQRIMVVDDEINLANLVAEYLELHNYRTMVFGDSLEAWANFEENPEGYSLVITDQTMPGLTGSELIDKVKEQTPDLPVILCSGIDANLDRYTADARMKKPYDLDELLALVEDQLTKAGEAVLIEGSKTGQQTLDLT